MMTLMLLLPFMIGDYVTYDNKHWECFYYYGISAEWYVPIKQHLMMRFILPGWYKRIWNALFISMDTAVLLQKCTIWYIYPNKSCCKQKCVHYRKYSTQ